MRYEKKAVVSGDKIGFVLAAVWKHPLSFRKQFPDRRVNSIYLDTADFESLQMNLQGNSQREKWRMRWYGSLDNKVMINLERKWKQHLLGGKEIQSLGTFSKKTYLSALEKVQDRGGYVFPVVKVSYVRQYFISADKQLRLTVDTSINYQKVQDQQLVFSAIDDLKVVIELKYDQNHESERMTDSIATLPFRITKNSKYVNAMKGHWF